MKLLVVAYMHGKYDKRVWKTVKLFSERNWEIIYIYWSPSREKAYRAGNVMFEPVYSGYNNKMNVILKSFDRLRYEYAVCKRLVKFIKDVDLVYIHHFAYFLYKCPYINSIKQGKVIITDFHEYVPEEYGLSLSNVFPFIMNIGQYIYRYISKNSLGGVFVSKWVMNDVKKINPSIKSLWIPNYAISKRTPHTHKKKNIVLVGKVERNLSDNDYRILEILHSKYGFNVEFIGIRPKRSFINFTPFLPYEKMMDKLSNSAFSFISFLPHWFKKSEMKNYVYTMPHKFFDSIAAGTPVIVGKHFKEMSHIVEDYGIGIVIDPEDVYKSVEKIIGAWNEYERFIKNISIHQEEFWWSEENVQRFITFISQIAHL